MSKLEDIRVLSVCTSDTHGGAARAAYRIHQGMRTFGVDSRMFVKYKGSHDNTVHALSEYVPNNPIYKALDWCASKVKNKIQHYQWNKYPQRDTNFKSDLRSTRIHGALQSWEYDVLHLHWINQRFLPLEELQKVHKPIIWTLHDSWPFCGVCHVPFDCKCYEKHCGACPTLGAEQERDLAYKVFEKKRALYRDLDLHIVTPSCWLGECAKRSALLGRFPISVIPNCIDTELYRPMNKKEAALQLRLNPDKKYLLFGAMHATTDNNKGFDLLITALQQISTSDIELLIYGTDEKLDKYALPFPVHSLGYVHDDKKMTLLYNAASVTIVPSRSENLSNTVMESMACGTPVAAFNIGGNSDMIDHKGNGYLAEAFDTEDLSKGMQWCIEHNDNNKLGINARQKVLDTYAPEVICNQYAELYKSLCAQSPIK